MSGFQFQWPLNLHRLHGIVATVMGRSPRQRAENGPHLLVCDPPSGLMRRLLETLDQIELSRNLRGDVIRQTLGTAQGGAFPTQFREPFFSSLGRLPEPNSNQRLSIRSSGHSPLDGKRSHVAQPTCIVAPLTWFRGRFRGLTDESCAGRPCRPGRRATAAFWAVSGVDAEGEDVAATGDRADEVGELS
jgi:hypothetical protein